MSVLIALSTFVMALAAAARSTWSPCGRSMLSTITPIGERGRRGRYRSTAAFFVAGSVLGGAAFGLMAAGLAATVAALGPPPPLVIGVVAVAASFIAAASDAHLAGFSLPIHRRQVNERWLDTFRPWFYGLGFGCQIGTGFATYITTAALYLTVVLAALTASPPLALAAGVLFGVVRGSSVLLARHLDHPETLLALHHRLDRLDATASRAVVVIEVVVGFGVLAACWWPAAAVAALAVVVGWATRAVARRAPAPSPR